MYLCYTPTYVRDSDSRKGVWGGFKLNRNMKISGLKIFQKIYSFFVVVEVINSL